MRQLFDSHSKTAKEALYLESGKIPLGFIIKSRRLMYWWHLVSLSEEKNPLKNISCSEEYAS